MLLKKYEQEIKELKSELAMHDALANRGHIHYEPYTEEQKYEMQQTVRRFIAGQIEEIEVKKKKNKSYFLNEGGEP